MWLRRVLAAGIAPFRSCTECLLLDYSAQCTEGVWLFLIRGGSGPTWPTFSDGVNPDYR
jgi:hypothetical protein